ncbi:N-acetylornithine carbamoyltransferase [Candidatus Acetothermia bacterium]|nr:N-acetylornithine carbamoyltransferase [Candidatus Bipolaricaulota bacterium]RLE39835.1 MAG: N-acetylornithine carbamoyltransferase [Candidatus Acetothermia bacterium]
MSSTSLRGRDFLTWLDFTRDEIEAMLDTAHELKRKQIRREPHRILDGQTLFMLFYNASLRTRNSFEAGMTQLGGHAHFLQPGAVYTPALKGEEIAYKTERISDVARVLAEMGDAIAIRIYGKHTGWQYGKGHLIIQEFAKWARIPVINMEDDMYHPCQALADVMTMQEKLGHNLQGKKFVMSWAYSGSVEKPLAVPQSAIISAAMMGMDVTLAHPKGLDLDPKVLEATKNLAKKNGGKFQIVHDMNEAFKDADVVYPKAWTVQPTDGSGPMDPEKAKAIFEANKDWITTKEKMELTNDAIYMHCLPADRDMEVTDEVIDGPNSVIIEEAGNRLHGQKGMMALIMG